MSLSKRVKKKSTKTHLFCSIDSNKYQINIVCSDIKSSDTWICISHNYFSRFRLNFFLSDTNHKYDEKCQIFTDCVARHLKMIAILHKLRIQHQVYTDDQMMTPTFPHRSHSTIQITISIQIQSNRRVKSWHKHKLYKRKK